jgi:NAD dependent epimerase/dehydratase family enzyme
VTNGEFTRTLARVLSRPALLVAPTPVLRGVLGTGFADELLLASQRVWPRRLLETGFQFRQPDLEGALRTMLAA